MFNYVEPNLNFDNVGMQNEGISPLTMTCKFISRVKGICPEIEKIMKLMSWLYNNSIYSILSSYWPGAGHL